MHRLNSFKIFTQNNYKLSVDELIEQINEGRIDQYGVLEPIDIQFYALEKQVMPCDGNVRR